MRDWMAISAALKIDLTDTMRLTLEALDKTMLGLRGLIDWQEEPMSTFAVPEPEHEDAAQ